MAKTYDHLWPQIITFENLHTAYLKARRGKRFSPDVLAFSADLEESLLSIQEDLVSKRYRTSAYRCFFVYEPKKRMIAALPFRDRVVHHALCNVIEPIWEARFIDDNYACRVGKGTHAAADRLTAFLRRAHRQWGQVYVLKLDVKSYFPSVNHEILMELIRRKITCRDTLWLVGEIVQSWRGDEGKGLPIGNLTSQLLANVYLHELDMFVKHNLRARYYLRYMDDTLVVHQDKGWLQQAKRSIGVFLGTRLALELNSKSNVFPAEQGVPFLGYRIWRTHRLLKKENVQRVRRRLQALAWRYATGGVDLATVDASVQSWLGHARHACTYGLRRRLFGEFVLQRRQGVTPRSQRAAG